MSKRKNPRGVYEKCPGSGIWYVRWKDETGRMRRRMVGSRGDAIKVAEQMRARVRLATICPELVAERQKPKLLKELLEFRVATSVNKTMTRKQEERHARQWARWLPGATLDQVTPAKLEMWRAERMREVNKRTGLQLAPATINRSLAFLKVCFSVAVREGWAKENPVRRIKLLRENNERDRFLSPEEFAMLRWSFYPETFQIIELAVLTGLRQGEQFNLRREEVDLARGLAKLGDPKGGRKEWVELTEPAVEILRELLDRHNSEWVFPGRKRGRPMSGRHFADAVFMPAVRELDLRDVTWHTLRHTFASWMAEAGVDLHVIKALCRHSTIRTTERYAHLSRGRRRAGADVLAKILAGTRGKPASPEVSHAREP